jgi:hypothetical protein
VSQELVAKRYVCHADLQATKNGDGKRTMNRIGITNYFVNTIITSLQAQEWEELLQRLVLF